MAIVDLAFRLVGGSVSADHGYALYAAVSKIIGRLHRESVSPADADTPWGRVGIHPIRGRALGERGLGVAPGVSRLTIRVDAELIPEFLALAGKTMRLDGSTVQVGVPEVRPLVPAARLVSRLVVIKGFKEAVPFLQAVQRQLDELGIKATPGLPLRTSERPLEGKCNRSAEQNTPVRRTLRVKDREIVGFAVEVTGLSAEESILLQERGIGGRRRLGCGIFVPLRR